MARGPESQTAVVRDRDLEISRIATQCEPYHHLEMGHDQAKTVFIFVSDAIPDTVRGYRLASQLSLADGLGFKGSETEKVLYADVMMLSWNADLDSAVPCWLRAFGIRPPAKCISAIAFMLSTAFTTGN